MKQRIELFNDSFQNFKGYGIPKAQLVIADVPYNIGTNFYGSNPTWYKGGIGRTVKAIKPVKRRFIRISTSTWLNTSISAIGC